MKKWSRTLTALALPGGTEEIQGKTVRITLENHTWDLHNKKQDR
jgi:hypothetical protein